MSSRSDAWGMMERSRAESDETLDPSSPWEEEEEEEEEGSHSRVRSWTRRPEARTELSGPSDRVRESGRGASVSDEMAESGDR